MWAKGRRRRSVGTGFILTSLFIVLIAFTVEDLRQRKPTGNLAHSATLMGGIEEEESYEVQH
jgi:hypothetical protein